MVVRRILGLRVRDLRLWLDGRRALAEAQQTIDTAGVGDLAVLDRTETVPVAGTSALAHEIALAVNRAARFSRAPATCLPRAIALHRLLEEHGVHGSHVRVGVRVQADEFAAHAWVEWNGEVLGDSTQHVRSFTVVDDLSVLLPQ